MPFTTSIVRRASIATLLSALMLVSASLAFFWGRGHPSAAPPFLPTRVSTKTVGIAAACHVLFASAANTKRTNPTLLGHYLMMALFEPVSPSEELHEASIHSRQNVTDRLFHAIATEIRRWLPFLPTGLQQFPSWRQQPQVEQKKSKARSVDIQSERRVGAWCSPDLRKSDEDKVSVVSCPTNGSSKDRLKNDVNPGMVVYVFPKGEFNVAESDTSLETIDGAYGVGENGMEDDRGTSAIHGTRCLLEMGQQYDNEEQVLQYTLLQKEPVELGMADVHRQDFAYQPVALTIDDGSSSKTAHTSDGISYYGHELEARVKPGTSGSTVMPVEMPIQQQLPWTEGEYDRQVSFRWWSWVTQFVPSRENYLADEKSLASSGSAISDSSSYHDNVIYEKEGDRPFAGGSHGEIWRARRRCPINDLHTRQRETTGPHSSNQSQSFSCDDGKDLIVKRLKIEYGYAVLEAGLREVYFGELLAREVESSNLFTKYVDHFFRAGSKGQIELWIVFENAGPSLRSFLYTSIPAGGYVVFENSSFWRRLRRSIAADAKSYKPDKQHKEDDTQGFERDSPEGRVLLREVLKQLLTAVAFLHERGIVHRDIKPSNVMCRTTPPDKDGVMPHQIETVQCALGDFSSAWDEFSARNLYPPTGPSSKEQTDEYAPPEVLFQGGRSWSPFSHVNPFSYDSWSIGVVALEILLGTPNVFSVDQRTKVLLTHRLKKEGASDNDIQRALYLAALSQFCIYVPTESEETKWPLRRGDPLHDVNVVKKKCALVDFHSALRARDPLGTGYGAESNTLLHLVWRLLAWNSADRLTAADALNHPYFTSQMNQAWNPTLFPFTAGVLVVDTVDVHGPQNALEHQTLDPRVDISNTAAVSRFVCPKCGKVYTDHNSCQKHARSRRHGHFCTYDRSNLPQCLNAHSMLPTHPTSGYCDIQGRRPTIEDFHTVHLNPTHQFYGVFDGHLGNLASKYAASSFYHTVKESLSDLDNNVQSPERNWKEDTNAKLEQSFQRLHNGIIDAVTSSPGGVMDESGTTATILFVTELALIIANVGDSRAIMSQWTTDSKGNQHMSARQLTVDHVASSANERVQILERGGYISESGGIDRVNGRLAVSRSLGDINLAPFLSRTPHVLALTKIEAYQECGKLPSPSENILPCFIILASDGLWDVMSNQEAVDLAWQVIKQDKVELGFQEAAEVLTQEAYVRGSSDNIGVCLVAIA